MQDDSSSVHGDLGTRRIAGSWRGASSPPEHCRGALEQGILWGSPLALTSLHTLMHVYRSCLCMCVFQAFVCVNNRVKKLNFPLRVY